MIPNEAVEAALDAFYLGSKPAHPHDVAFMRAALEAALPTLLSHEREETRLRDLPTVETIHQFGHEYAQSGEWTLDPREEPDPLEAWENAKAWAAYALWLQDR